MIDFKHIINQPNADIQVFVGGKTTVSYSHWETWEKPRGAKWIYMMAVGAGGSGSTGIAGTGSGAGGSGGGSGGQTTTFLPAFFVPDLLFVDVGSGGAPVSITATDGNTGTNTDIRSDIGQSTFVQQQVSFCFAFGGAGGSAPTGATVGGTGGSAGAISQIGNSVPAGRGIYTFLAGQTGTDGGTNGSYGVNQFYPTTGLCVTGGTGGGGGGNTIAYGGGGFIGPGANNTPDFAPYGNSLYMPGVAPGAPTVSGQDGWNQLNNIFSSGQGFIMNRGGQGGGGSGTGTPGIAGSGGAGAPGCGGGGQGGMTITAPRNTVTPSGAGGPGFAIIISF
jgi:hypothetical protein